MSRWLDMSITVQHLLPMWPSTSKAEKTHAPKPQTNPTQSKAMSYKRYGSQFTIFYLNIWSNIETNYKNTAHGLCLLHSVWNAFELAAL